MIKSGLNFAFLAVVLVALPLSGDDPRYNLGSFRPELGSVFSSDPSGTIAVLEPSTRRLTTFVGEARASSCVVDGIADDLPVIALNGLGQALLARGGSNEITLRVLETRSCRELARVTRPGSGLVQRVAGSDTGWAVMTSNSIRRFDPLVRTETDEAVPESVQRVASGKSANPGASEALPLLLGKDLWLIPKASYHLVRPTPVLDILPPVCLRSVGFDVAGQENVQWLERLLPEAAPRSRELIESMLAQARTGHGGAGFIGAVAAVATNAGRIAVLVRTERAHTCRLDVWDTIHSTLTSSVTIPGACPGFLAFTNSQAWTFNKDGFRSIALGPAPAEPCSH